MNWEWLFSWVHHSPFSISYRIALNLFSLIFRYSFLCLPFPSTLLFISAHSLFPSYTISYLQFTNISSYNSYIIRCSSSEIISYCLKSCSSGISYRLSENSEHPSTISLLPIRFPLHEHLLILLLYKRNDKRPLKDSSLSDASTFYLSTFKSRYCFLYDFIFSNITLPSQYLAQFISLSSRWIQNSTSFFISSEFKHLTLIFRRIPQTCNLLFFNTWASLRKSFSLLHCILRV